jgi:hypothetical protein
MSIRANLYLILLRIPEVTSPKTDYPEVVRSFLLHHSGLQAYFNVCHDHFFIYKQNKLRGFSPPANYTDRAAAACRRS